MNQKDDVKANKVSTEFACLAGNIWPSLTIDGKGATNVAFYLTTTFGAGAGAAELVKSALEKLKLRGNDLQNNYSPFFKGGGIYSIFVGANLLRGAFYNTGSNTTKAWLSDESFYAALEIASGGLLALCFTPMYQDNTARHTPLPYTLSTTIQFFYDIYTRPLILQAYNALTIPAISYAGYQAIKSIYFELSGLNQEQVWIYNSILCDIRTTSQYSLTSKESNDLAAFIRYNIPNYKSDLIQKIHQAIADSGYNNINWMLKTISYIANSSLPSSEQKRFFDAVLAMKDNASFAITEHLLDELKLAFTHTEYDLDTARLLADYITIKQQQKVEYSLKHFKFEHNNLTANQRQIIKEVINSLEKLNQKLVEFCSFYVPYNLDEKKLRDFLNKNSDDSSPKVNVDKLNLRKALTGQNMELLKELQRFFIEENKAKFNNSTAGYTNSIMAQVYDYVTQEISKIAEKRNEEMNRKAKVYNKMITNYNDTDKSKIETLYLDDYFLIQPSSWEEVLVSSISINYIPELIKNLPLWGKNSSVTDLLKSYDLAIDLTYSANIFLPSLPDATEQYYQDIFHSTAKYTKNQSIYSYIIEQSKKFSLDFWKKHDLYKPEILMTPYWFSNIQIEKFNYMQDVMQQNIANLHEPLFNEFLSRLYAGNDRNVRAKELHEKAIQQLLAEDIDANLFMEYLKIYFPETEKNSKNHFFYTAWQFEMLGNRYEKDFTDLMPNNFTHLVEKLAMNAYSSLNSAIIILLQQNDYLANRHSALLKVINDKLNGDSLKWSKDLYNDLLDGFLSMEWLLQKSLALYGGICEESSDLTKASNQINCKLNDFHFYSLQHSCKLALGKIANLHPRINNDKYNYPAIEQLSVLTKAHNSLKGMRALYDGNLEDHTFFLSYVDNLILGNKLNIIHTKKAHDIDFKEDCQFFATQLSKNFITPLNTDVLNSYQQVCGDYIENGQSFASEHPQTPHDEL
jgi:hypothetical protein